jgi:1-aminocyclopropane-1-carboxylate deaminase
MLTYTPTPIQEIHDPLLQQAGVRMFIKREDLNHPLVSGNKWWKLKYNLVEARKQGKKILLTFGGAYSNHIFATAAAAHALGFESIGVIRGEETLPLNDTLLFATAHGMNLCYVSREDYRLKDQPAFMDLLHEQFGDFYPVPEGGTNALAVQGTTEFAASLGNAFDYLCSPVGTGGTLAGLVNGVSPSTTVIGFSSLKGGDFLNAEVSRWLKAPHANWEIITSYHFGGYAKVTDALVSFQQKFMDDHAILFDQVYGAKMMFGVFDLVRRSFFERGSKVLVIHTGGLQKKMLL